MADVLRTASFESTLFDYRMKGVFSMAIREMPNEIAKIFNKEKTDRHEVRKGLVTSTGPLEEKAKGTSIQYDSVKETYTRTSVILTYALGLRMEEEFYEDDPTTWGKRFAKFLARSAHYTDQMHGTNIINRAFSSSYLGADGKVLCAADHPVNGGTGTAQSNVLTTAANLDYTSYHQMNAQLRKMTDDRGMPMMSKATKLVVGIDNDVNAHEILHSPQRPDTPNRAINAVKEVYGRVEIVPLTLQSNQKAWFLLGDQHSLTMYDRVAATFGRDNEFNTGDRLYKVRRRVKFDWLGYQDIIGTPGV